MNLGFSENLARDNRALSLGLSLPGTVLCPRTGLPSASYEIGGEWRRFMTL